MNVLTKRDLFAAFALAGIRGNSDGGGSYVTDAEDAYAAADAMLTKRTAAIPEAKPEVAAAAPLLLEAARAARELIERTGGDFAGPDSEERRVLVLLNRAIEEADPGTNALRALSEMVERTRASNGDLGL